MGRRHVYDGGSPAYDSDCRKARALPLLRWEGLDHGGCGARLRECRVKPLLAIAWLLACASGDPAGVAAERFCPIDSLTTYNWLNRGDTISYIPSGRAAYSLTFDRGRVTPVGRYDGLFRSAADGTLSQGNFTLPTSGVEGHYAVTGDSMTLVWPLSAGPTWFWEVARHSAPRKRWETVLDDSTHGVGPIQVHFTWELCS